MHAIRVLEEDHERIEALFVELSRADAANKARLFDRLERELVIHTIAEDNVFLPQVEEALEDSRRTSAEFFESEAEELREANGLISASYEDHRRIPDLLERARELRFSETAFDELKEAVEAQIEREGALLPKARKVLEEEDFERIGNLIEHCKGQVRGLTQAKLASSASFEPARGRATVLREEIRSG
ncbi:MAG: hypothetical protein ACRDTR_20445 [Rubrobacter sp.]